MIFNYYIRKILTDENLLEVNRIINSANDKDIWQNGLKSGGGTSSIKSNLELSCSTLSSEINSMIMEKLDFDNKFISFTTAKETGLNIVSKTSTGNYYNPHIDNWGNGDFSTTVFLNSPDEYIGGELCLYFGNGEEKKVKLEAGWGITYSTGILHRVNEVVSGVRYASVFWTKSHIKNSQVRSLIYNIELVKDLIKDYKIPIHPTTCESSLQDPIFILNNIKNELYRNNCV